MPPLLEMRGIAKRYSGVVALDEVDVDVDAGEIHAILGENGAGKSTLMKILAGSVRADRGTIAIGSTREAIASPRDAQKRGIAIIYQEFTLVPALTVAENIFLGREPSSMGVISRARMTRDAGALLRHLGLTMSPAKIVRTLGVAEQQMVEIAKALAFEARILVMDEPTAALTSTEIARLFEVIRSLRERGVAIIYISHRMEELYQIADRVTVLRDGRKIATRLMTETNLPELIQWMVGRKIVEQFPPRELEASRDSAELLRAEGLCRAGILDHVSFTLRRGEVLGIAGLMGAGRTELARVVFGVDRLDSGRIWLHGNEVRIDSPRRAIDLGIGFLTEDRKRQGLVMSADIVANICMASLDLFSRAGIMAPTKETSAAARLAGEVRIRPPHLRQRAMNLSGGNQQKVVLAKWLCREAQILIFDEPTRGIDVGAKAEIYRLVRRLTAEGKAVILISSELPEILGMSDRIVVMCRGRVAGEFAGDGTTQEQLLSCALGEQAA